MNRRKKIKNEILIILKSIAPEIDEEKLEEEENIRDQVDLDSIDYLNFLTKIGKTLNILIPERDYNKIETINSMIDYLSNEIHS